MLINTFKRPDRLKLAVEHYAQCGARGAAAVKAIHVVWSEQAPAPTDEYGGEMYGVPVVFDVHPTTSLNNRFRPLPSPRSEAVLSVDDDIRVDCGDLQFALEAWRAAPRSMVGFVARTVSGRPGHYQYRHFWSTWLTGRYSMVLTKVAIVHHDYLRAYTDEAPRRAYAWVEEHKNCEDILMSFVVAAATRAPPLWASGKYRDSGALDGISTSGGGVGGSHKAMRSQCVNDFVEKDYDGRMPLVMGEARLTRARSYWNALALAPTWLEWFAPL